VTIRFANGSPDFGAKAPLLLRIIGGTKVSPFQLQLARRHELGAGAWMRFFVARNAPQNDEAWRWRGWRRHGLAMRIDGGLKSTTDNSKCCPPKGGRYRRKYILAFVPTFCGFFAGRQRGGRAAALQRFCSIRGR